MSVAATAGAGPAHPLHASAEFQLARALQRSGKTPEAKEQLLKLGLEVVASSPEQLAAIVKTETERLGKVIREAGIRIE